MTDLTGRKPILCLDFDGVCHKYNSGWKGAAVIPDDPVPGLFHFITEAIFSSRSNQEGGVQAMKEWFEKHAPGSTSLLHFPTEKPPAFLGIDDRVLTFRGEWPSVEEMRNFKPWTNQEV